MPTRVECNLEMALSRIDHLQRSRRIEHAQEREAEAGRLKGASPRRAECDRSHGVVRAMPELGTPACFEYSGVAHDAATFQAELLEVCTASRPGLTPRSD